ncbi:MAG TPA: S-methyl-5-thioribose-1-phosphate isomerase, partial [Polyangiaceae bacterium]|nr:S-methyl-5-thioribose-1-phosphate isomerase [Polyangiaceae bacterium]
FVLDQRRLPVETTYITYDDVAGAAASIRDMVVRGAPAIGITAAYGMTLAAKAAVDRGAEDYLASLREAGQRLEATRPTAVNLAWAVRRCLDLGAEHATEGGEARWRAMAALARDIHRDDVASCRAMGERGAQLMPDGVALLTHCNAGALATGGYGTALGVVRATAEAGKLAAIYATETRPYLQGARLTAWELAEDGLPVTVITDSMVAQCMKEGRIGAVVVGADRIANNGDVANKIGTYGVAQLAKAHGIPFYVAAPWSTVDLDMADGSTIPIEQRARGELAVVGARTVVPDGVPVYNPAFDVTPAALVTKIVTERGIHEPSELAAAAPG